MMEKRKRKKKKNKTDSIIKAISYCIAGIIVICSIKSSVGTEYNNIFNNIGKYGSIVAIVIVVIAVILGIYKLVRYLRHKEVQEDKDVWSENRSEAFTKDKK